MGRLRVRDPDNSKWIDICQSEWYVRNSTDSGWVRILPNGKLSVRHGTDNYWIEIDCLTETPPCPESDEPPPTDPYGGTSDGVGTGTDGSGGGGSPSSGGGGLGGIGTVAPGYVTGIGGVSVWAGPGSAPGFTGSSSSGGSGFGNEFDGSNTGGGTGDNGGNGLVETDEEGNLCLPNPDTGDCDSYSAGGNGTSDRPGTYSEPGECPDTVYSNGNKVYDRYIDVGTQAGTVIVDYNISEESAQVQILHNGVTQSAHPGFQSGTGSLRFSYSASTSESIIGVRVIGSSDNTQWSYTVRCPNSVDDDTPGTNTHPAACHGTYLPEHGGGGGVSDMIHDMGSESGIVVIEYQMWNIADKLEVYQRGNLIKSTGGFVAGEGRLEFPYSPAGGDTFVTLRVTSSSTDTSWVYLIYCPGDNGEGSSTSPKACEEDSEQPAAVTHSGGAGVTDTYYDMGALVGNVRVRYQMWYVEDSLEVYQNNTLVASTNGAVVGEGHVDFNYNPANGTDIRVRVTGAGYTTWVFLVECAYDIPVINVDSISAIEGGQATFTVSLEGGASSRDIEVSYHFENVTGSGSDYDTSNAPGTLTIPAGQTSGQITIDILTDSSSNEGSETVNLVIDDATNADVGDNGTGVLTIEEDIVDVTCGENYIGQGATTVSSVFTGGDNMFVLVEYSTVASTIPVPTGAPNRIQIAGNGTVLEDTITPQFRYDDYGYGTLTVPINSSINSLELRNPEAASYWRQTAYCPITWPAQHVFTKFSVGLPAAREIADFLDPAYGDLSPSAAKPIAVASSDGTNVDGESVVIFCTMIHTISGNVTITGTCDDVGEVRLWSDNGPILSPSPNALNLAGLRTLSVSLSADTTYFLAVAVHNVPPGNNPSWLNMYVKDSGKYICVTGQDWKAEYLDQRSYGGGNDSIFETQDLLIFDSVAEANSYMTNNAAPTTQDIFDNWSRATHPDSWFTSGATATGDAADWYYDSAQDTFIQPNNVGSANIIVSPDSSSGYTLEATLSSSNGDNDGIGLVIATVESGGIIHTLAAVRTKGGVKPALGFGIIYYQGNTQNVITDINIGGVAGGWSGAFSRVKIQRVGDTIVYGATNWGATSPFTEFTLNLNDHASLAIFKGAKPYGFLTYSQADSKYLDVDMPNSTGLVFNYADSHTWESVNGNWVDRGTSTPIGQRVSWPKIATNPITNNKYYIFGWMNRKI